PNEWHDASLDLVEILTLSREVWTASEGAFDPTVGSLTALWRPHYFPVQQICSTGKSTEQAQPLELPTPVELESALARVGMNFLELDTEHNRIRFDQSGMRLDFGGI